MADNENLNNEELDNEEFEEDENYIELEDEDGNPVPAEIIHDFFYNGENYLALQLLEEEAPEEPADENEPEQIGVFFMKIVPFEENGEEMEDLVMVEDEELAEELIRVMQESMENDADLDDAD